MRQLGVIGLGTMGANLARNAARNGAEVAVFNRTTEKVDAFMSTHGNEGMFVACKSAKEVVEALKPQRTILLMVNAGPPVDQVIGELASHLSPGDIVIDAGNSHFADSTRRERELNARGFKFLGMGVSGGEKGALEGPSMMTGGNREAFEVLEPLLRKMTAKDGSRGKCVAYMGPGGAGHFVKMVHNGIEYGDMQLICEAYHLLRYVSGLGNGELADLFEQWNKGRDLKSYLIEITAKIFRAKDPETGGDLIDVILDKAGQKGTGKWTVSAAMDLGIVIPTVTAAVDARLLSSWKEERLHAAKTIEPLKLQVKTPRLSPGAVKSALVLSKICSYAQGFALLTRASAQNQWNVNVAEVSRIWKGGCIIRSAMLKEFERVFSAQPELKNLLLDPVMLEIFSKKHAAWRKVIALGAQAGVPLPAMTASLSYFDGYFHERLPANLLQAQRDFFGAHTYERVDKPGSFHTNWET